eukprot:TRINITY_DN11392_c0_g1_i1.p1 TRINITY_DN11392_c0_g1~~TRINITY_DN11392_c0_g1_i1.p1  ORF type:complete len:189 (+),score=36.10 TRINITY_DN11392_c0_g1_i1:17-583(+)
MGQHTDNYTDNIMSEEGWDEMSEITTEQIGDLLKLSHEFAFKTGSDVLVILVRRGRIFSYATPNLKPLIEEEQGRALIVKLLYDKYKDQLMTMDGTAHENLDHVQYEPEDFIVDDDERYDYLVSTFTVIRDRFLNKTLPRNPSGVDGIFLAATLARQILQMSSPTLAPMVKTQEGMNLIQMLLSNGRN